MNDFTLLIPEFLLLALAFSVLAIDLIIPKLSSRFVPLVIVFSLLGLIAFSLIHLWDKSNLLYDGILLIDFYSLFFKVFFLIIGIFIVLISINFVRMHLDFPGEYYGILLMSLLGMVLMASSGELLTAYISLELLSFSLYILVSFDRYNPKSNEAGTKFILLGAFSSALLLYGISQVYGQVGSTYFKTIGEYLLSTPDLDLGIQTGLVLIIAGFCFKIAAIPFHMWAPDTYEGAPIPVAAYIAVGSKVASFALMLRLFTEALIPAIGEWQFLIAIIAAISMSFGNLFAIVQSNIKRLLAYSGIGHTGYILMGLVSLATISGSSIIDTDSSKVAINGLIFHLVTYSAASLSIFLCVSTIYNSTGREDLGVFAGLAKRSPGIAMIITGSLFSLAGLPIFAGFTSKFYLFNAAAINGFLWLSGLAIFTSLIALYYYLNIIKRMYLEPSEETGPLTIPILSRGVLGVLFIGLILFGIYPNPLMEGIQVATETLMSSSAFNQIDLKNVIN